MAPSPPLTALLLLLLSVIPVHARPNYPDRIPNGRAPTTSGLTCLFLGHRNCIPGAPRNQFGLDFAAANRQWTKKLCEMDSDGDGLTNGQERGAPCCMWATGDAAAQAMLREDMLSHPGDASSTNKKD